MKWILLAFVCWYCYRAGQELGRAINRRLYGDLLPVRVYDV